MNNITKYRLRQNMNQTELAKAVGVTRQLISFAETQPITYERAVKLSGILQVNPFELMGNDAIVALPKTKEDKEALLKIVNELEVE